MRNGTWRASPLALVSALVIAAAAILSFFLAKHSVDSQNQALLREDVTQAAGYVSSLTSTLSSTLDALAPGVTSTNGSAAAFEAQAKPLAGGPFTLLLARKSGANFVASAVAGNGFTKGEVLDAPLTAVLGKAGSSVVPGPVTYDGKTSTFGLGLGPPLVPEGFAIYELVTLDPFVATTATQAAPFHVLRAAVYATRVPTTGQLVLANTRALPLTGTTFVAPVAVGSGSWWLVAEAKSPLAGRFPNAAPYVVLVFVLLLALAVGSVIEVVVRRQRYASALVAERTTELLASQEALVRSERLSAVGQMTTVVGHELRNPLGAVMNALYMLRRSLGDPAAAEPHLAVAERQTARAVNLAQDLTAYMREREPELAPMDLAEVLSDVLEVTPKPTNVVVVDDVGSIELNADSKQIAQILTNLVDNAYQAMPDGGSLRIEAHTEGATAIITVEDSGEGVDQELVERFFEPFFTTRSDGTGLGLAIVRRLTDAHGGEISIQNGPSGGAVVTLRLPIEPTRELAWR
ncbi:MAG TPA: ATP-binding protein [Acidimicrobiales bacterium]|nr:ATP-binding protein [Acidimicrobiales bacterium]